MSTVIVVHASRNRVCCLPGCRTPSAHISEDSRILPRLPTRELEHCRKGGPGNRTVWGIYLQELEGYSEELRDTMTFCLSSFMRQLHHRLPLGYNGFSIRLQDTGLCEEVRVARKMRTEQVPMT